MFQRGQHSATLVGKNIIIETNDPLHFLEEMLFSPSEALEKDTIFMAQKITGLSTSSIEKLKAGLSEIISSDNPSTENISSNGTLDNAAQILSVLNYLKPQMAIGGNFYNPIDQSVLDSNMKICDIISHYNIDKTMEKNIASFNKLNGEDIDVQELIKKKSSLANDQRLLKEYPGAIKKYNQLDALLAKKISKGKH